MFVCFLVLSLLVVTSDSELCSDTWCEGHRLIDSPQNIDTGLSYVTVEFVTYVDADDSDISTVTFWLEYRRSNEETPPVLDGTSEPASNIDSSETSSLTVSELLPNTEYDLWLLLRKDECYPEGCHCTCASSTVIKETTDALDWYSYSGREYFVSRDVNYYLNLYTANSFCRDHGDAMLMSISDETENIFVTDRIYSGDYCWLGLRFPENVDAGNCRSCTYCSDTDSGSHQCELCESCRSQWYWIDENQSSFAKWGSEQPKEGNTCAAVAKTGYWLDVDCTEQHYFVCYRDASSTTTTTTTSDSPPLTDWQIATIAVSGAFGLLLLCFLVTMGCVCNMKSGMKQKVVPGGGGVYQTGDGKADLTVNF